MTKLTKQSIQITTKVEDYAQNQKIKFNPRFPSGKQFLRGDGYMTMIKYAVLLKMRQNKIDKILSFDPFGYHRCSGSVTFCCHSLKINLTFAVAFDRENVPDLIK